MLLVGIVATLIVPFETFAIPMVYLVSNLPRIALYDDGFAIEQGWNNSYEVMIIPFIANAFSIFLFTQYYKSIPRELDEAAMIDGAGWFRIYRSVISPLAGPAFATAAILTFLPQWNSYLWPLLVIQDEELRPVQVGMRYFFATGTAEGTPVGRDHGLHHHDHDPRGRRVPALPAHVHVVDRVVGCQGMTLRLEDDWVWDSWPFDDDQGLHHLFFLKAPRSLGDPELRHVNATRGSCRQQRLPHLGHPPRCSGSCSRAGVGRRGDLDRIGGAGSERRRSTSSTPRAAAPRTTWCSGSAAPTLPT